MQRLFAEEYVRNPRQHARSRENRARYDEGVTLGYDSDVLLDRLSPFKLATIRHLVIPEAKSEGKRIFPREKSLHETLRNARLFLGRLYDRDHYISSKLRKDAVFVEAIKADGKKVVLLQLTKIEGLVYEDHALGWHLSFTHNMEAAARREIRRLS